MIGENKLEHTTPTLLALATVTRRAAQRRMDFSEIARFTSCILCLSAFYYSFTTAWIAVMIGLICKIASSLLNWQGKRLHRVSREVQRLALLEDSFGKTAENFQLVELKRRIGPKFEKAARIASFEQPYYSSSQKTGPERLKESVQQSTFWSRSLLEYYAKRIRNTFSILAAIMTSAGILLWHMNLLSHSLIDRLVLLFVASNIFIFVIIDYINVYLSCKSSIMLLHEVDQLLDRVDVSNYDTLLANFADYSVATLNAPPIPYNLYIRHHSYLKDLWRQRLGKMDANTHIQGVSVESLLFNYDEHILPSWILSKDFSSLIRSAAIDMSRSSDKPLPSKLSISRLHGYSGTPVYEIKMYQGNILWRQLVLRLHDSPAKARAELDIVRRITSEMADVISYTPLEEPYISKGALFFYHANIQTNDQLCSIYSFVERFIDTEANDFNDYFNKMFMGIKSVSKAYNNIRDFKLETFANTFSRINWGMPPAYILDLRKGEYTIDDNLIKIFQDGRLPSEADQVLNSPVNASTKTWIQNAFQVLAVRNYSTTIYEIDVSLSDGVCRILIEGKRVNGILTKIFNKVELLFIPGNCLQTLQQFFYSEHEIDLGHFDPAKTLSEFKGLKPREGLHWGFRHTDFHCENCLVSRSNFKVIDVSDSSEAMICSDIARLEISLISGLVRCQKLKKDDVAALLLIIDGVNAPAASPVALLVAKIIKQIRHSLISEFKANPADIDMILCYYIECCRQVSYSTSSPMCLSKGIDPLIIYWNNRLNEQLAK